MDRQADDRNYDAPMELDDDWPTVDELLGATPSGRHFDFEPYPPDAVGRPALTEALSYSFSSHQPQPFPGPPATATASSYPTSSDPFELCRMRFGPPANEAGGHAYIDPQALFAGRSTAQADAGWLENLREPALHLSSSWLLPYPDKPVRDFYPEQMLNGAPLSLEVAQIERPESTSQGPPTTPGTNINEQSRLTLGPSRQLVRIAPKGPISKRRGNPATKTSDCFHVFPAKLDGSTNVVEPPTKKQKRTAYCRKTCLRCQDQKLKV